MTLTLYVTSYATLMHYVTTEMCMFQIFKDLLLYCAIALMAWVTFGLGFGVF